jgi:hypothetical protein
VIIPSGAVVHTEPCIPAAFDELALAASEHRWADVEELLGLALSRNDPRG